METEIHIILANIWFFIINLILIVYVVLDGFDLGVGILTLFARDEKQRTIMMSSLGGVWDANETWLVLLGGALFGAFPIVYATTLHALYIPVMAMLFGLIFRGVALEFHSLGRNKAFWNSTFGGGSLFAAAAQGFVIGGVFGEIPVKDEVFTGGAWDWLSAYSAISACGVIVTYLLFGSTYLIIKTDGAIQASCIRHAKVASAALITILLIILSWIPYLHPYVVQRWLDKPAFFYLALMLIVIFIMLFYSLQKHQEASPFFWSVLAFILSFGLIASSYYPYLIPAAITIQQAASPSKTLIFMLTGIGMMIPVMLIYNGYQYFVFRGKIRMKNIETIST